VGAPPHWRSAVRHDGHYDAVGAPPQWRNAIRCVPVARRLRGVAPLALRPPSRQAPRRSGCAAPLAIRPPLRPCPASTPGRRPTGAAPAARNRGRRPTGDTPSAATTGATTPWGRRPTGDTPSAASLSRVDFGASPHWRYALRHDRRHDAVGAPPHWRYVLRCVPVPRRPRGVAPLALRPPYATRGVDILAIRPLSRQAARRCGGATPLVIRPPLRRRAPQRRWGAAPMAIRPPPRPRRAATSGRRPTGATPSVATGATTPWGRRPTGDPPFAATAGATTPWGRRPTGDTPSAASLSRVDFGASPHWRYALRHDGRDDAVGPPPHGRYALRCVFVARRPRGVAPLALRPPYAPCVCRSRGTAPLAGRPSLRTFRAPMLGCAPPARADSGARPLGELADRRLRARRGPGLRRDRGCGRGPRLGGRVIVPGHARGPVRRRVE